MIPEAPREHEKAGAASAAPAPATGFGEVYGRSYSSLGLRLALRCLATAWRSKYSI
jgi:hypothetical protein